MPEIFRILRVRHSFKLPATIKLIPRGVSDYYYAIMRCTKFKIRKMDCAAEENIVRMKLANVDGIQRMDFDLENRTLTLYHIGDHDRIVGAIDTLNFDCSVVSTENISDYAETPSTTNEWRLLIAVLAINLAFFVIEVIAGVIAESMGLIADSLDMLADAIVYALSLYAIGRAATGRKKITLLSGYFQITLALIGFVEVLRRFLQVDEIPDYHFMIIVSFFALWANGLCLYLLKRSQSTESHIKASMIFTSNDVIINVSVIVAGVMVHLFNSRIPDLVIGGIVFIIVKRGATSILKLASG